MKAGDPPDELGSIAGLSELPLHSLDDDDFDHLRALEKLDMVTRYRITGRVGRGGMGEVLLAWDGALEREVALKRVQPELDEGELAVRLLREARLCGNLDHPGIVPVHDLGVFEDGQPYYAMRLIRGRSLSEARAELSLAQCVRHLLAATQAVAYTHSRGIVHRDLKADNIMVGSFGEAQVVDWGLAKRVDEFVTAGGLSIPGDGLTRVGVVVGTPRYLAPELHEGQPASPTTDTYALGATLIELAAGEAASDVTGWRELAEAIADRELRAVALRAIAEPQARYPDAAGLAADLGAWLDGRRVSAHEYTSWELLVRLVRAWRAPLGAGLAAAAVGVVALTASGLRILEERDRALHAEAVADEALSRELAERAVEALSTDHRARAEHAAARALAIAEQPAARGVLMAYAEVPLPAVETLPTTCEGEHVVSGGGWLCAAGDRLLDADGRVFHEGPWSRAGVLSVGPYAVDSHGDATLHGQPLLLPIPVVETPLGLAGINGREVHFDVDGALHAYLRDCPRNGSSDAVWRDGHLWTLCGMQARGWTPEGLATEFAIEALPDAVLTLAAVDGRLVTGGQDNRLFFTTLGTGHTTAVDSGVPRVRRVSASEDGRWLRVTGVKGEVALFDVDRMRPVLALGEEWADSVFWRGRLTRGGASLVTLDPSALVTRSHVADAGLAFAFLSPDGREVAAGDGAGQLRVYDRETREQTHLFDVDGSGALKWLAFGRGEAAVSGVSEMPTRFGPSWERLGPLSTPQTPRRLFFLDSVGWVGVSWTGGAYPIDGETRPPDTPAIVDAGQSGSAVLALLDSTGGLLLWSGDAPETIATLDVSRARVDVDPRGERIVVAGAGQVRVLGPDGAELRRWPVRDVEVLDVAIHPDRELLATAHLDGSVSVFDLDGHHLAELVGVHEERVATVQFQDDSLLTASWDGRAHVWGLGPLTRDPPSPESVAAAWALPPPVPGAR